MIHLAKKLARRLWLLLWLLIVLSALILSLGRLLTPLAANYRVEIEQLASDALGRAVTIDTVSAEWDGLGPTLVLRQVNLLDPEKRSALKIRQIRLQLALVDSLRSLTLKPRLITLSGLRLLIKRRSNDTLAIEGLEEIGGDGEVGGLFALPSRIRLENSEIYWENQLLGAAPMLFPGVQADLRNSPDRHQLEATLTLPGKPTGKLQLIADIRGNPEQPGQWSGDIYLKGQRLAIASLLRNRIPTGYEIPHGSITLELWSHWQAGHLASVEGSGRLSSLRLLQQGGDDGQPKKVLNIDRLGGAFRWRQQDDGWTLDVRDIDLSRAGFNWPPAAFSLAVRFDEQGQVHLRTGADFIRVQDLAAIIRMFPLPDPTLEEALDNIQPQSDLRNLRFRYQEQGQQAHWSGRGEIDHLDSLPWRHLPGLENLSSRFWFDQDQGTLELDSSQSKILFPGLFRDPLQLEQLQGRLAWQRLEQGGWRIDTKDLQAKNSDITTSTRLSMTFPSDPEASIYMDLQTDFQDGNAVHAHRYYPVGIMPKAVVKWLDRSIVSGRVVSGSALVRGPLHNFPFSQTHDGRFEVFFHTRDLQLDYWPGWPQLTGLTAQVRFLNDSFDTWVTQGAIYDSRLRQAHGHIRELSKGTPFELDGEIDGDLNDVLRLLRESPLAEEFAALTTGIDGSGSSRMSLDLTIPIDGQGGFRLQGSLALRQAQLKLAEWGLSLDRIQGAVQFDQASIRANGIQAMVQGSPLELSVETRTASRSTRITASLPVSAQQLTGRLPEPLLERIQGSSPWTLMLDIPHRSNSDQSIRFKAGSGLQGLALNLPPPLGKPAALQRQLSISGRLGGTGRQPLQLRYGQLLDVFLQLEKDATGKPGIAAADIRLGGDRAQPPTDDGLTIRGRLKRLDLTQWKGMGGESGIGTIPPLQQLQLKINRLSLDGSRIDDLRLDLNRGPQGLAGDIAARRFNGSLLIPQDQQQAPVRMQLKRLDLTFAPDDLPEENEATATRAPDPATLPALELDIDRVRVNNHDFGRLQLISRHVENGLELQALNLNSKLLQLSATGSWTRPADGNDRTLVDFSLATKSMGDLLSDLGFTHNIDQTPTEIESQLSWDDWPLAFDPSRLNGELSMQLGKGVITKVNPGIGRILGLLNVTALQRRLRLDFSDLVKEGFAFDSIEASFLLEEGDAYSNDFIIKGPSARIDISGRIGLGSEDLDQLVTVTPHISAVLPLAGVIAGGPVGAAAMLLAQGLVGNEFNKASQRQYRITGPWDAPKLEPLSAAASNTSRSTDEENRNLSEMAAAVQKDAPAKDGSEDFFSRLKKALTPTGPTYGEDDRKGAGDQ